MNGRNRTTNGVKKSTRRTSRVAPCTSCGERQTKRRRASMCWKCRMETGKGYGASRPRDFYGAGKTPRRPSEYLPGHPRKVRELAARAGRGESLFSVADRERKVNLK